MATALAMTFGACGGTATPLPQAPPVPGTGGVATTPAPAGRSSNAGGPAELESLVALVTPGEVTVTVLDAGKGKKERLEYALVPRMQSVETTWTNTSQFEPMGFTIVGPLLWTQFTVEVAEVADDGSARVRLTLVDRQAQDAPNQTEPYATAEAQATLVGPSGTTVEYTMSRDGKGGDETLTFPPGLPAKGWSRARACCRFG